MSKISVLYFMMTKLDISKEDYLILVRNENEDNDVICSTELETEIVERLAMCGRSNIKKIYISKKISVDCAKKINDLYGCRIFLPPNDIPYPNYVIYCDDFQKEDNVVRLINDMNKLCDVEPELKKLYDKLSIEKKSNIKAIKDLLKYELIIKTQNGLEMTDYGKLIFSYHCLINRSITTREIGMNNNLYFLSENYFDEPLCLSRNDICKLIYEKLPTFQSRYSVRSVHQKPISKENLQSFIDYCLYNNDYSLNKKIEFEISPTSICCTLYKNNDVSMRNIFVNFFKTIKFADISKTGSENLFSFIESTKKGKTLYKLFFYGYQLNSNNTFSLQEKEILDLARRNTFFTRAMVDQFLDISPRTSNLYINKLIEKGILSRKGIGKACTYYLKENYDNFDIK